jgi:ribosomal protein S18 acetylase RimI-like enzyme
MERNTIRIEAMTTDNYDDVVNLWQQTPELHVVQEFDSQERIAAYLARNPGISTLAWDGEHIVGVALCGHDGRRGSLYHVAVAPSYRGQGIAKRMLNRCFSQLKAVGIETGFLFVYVNNTEAARFWKAMGWKQNSDLCRFSKAF